MKSSMFGQRLRLVALPAALSAFAFAASSAARADDTTEAPKKSDLDDAVQSTIFRGDAVSNFYDDVQKWKKDNSIPIEVGAWHWWHMNRNAPHDLHYGIPGLDGTYYYYLHFDPETDNGVGTKMGAHLDVRARDGSESFRPFFTSELWLWEAYAWVEACDMKFKAGKIWRRFGLDWDGSWYGNVAYFDGWKLDPDWGASVERTCDFGHGVTAPSFAQVFIAEDKVNGSISGADAESDRRAREKLSFSVRTVPTWKLDNGSSLALGLSAQTGRIDERDNKDHSVTAGALDLTYTQGAAKAFGEIMKANGSRNPANYVTGGPSDRAQDWLIGGSFTHGFATFRATISHGHYDNPSGSQVLYLLGVTLAVTKNVDFYVEYVRWDTHARGGPRAFYEDGINFILNWRF